MTNSEAIKILEMERIFRNGSNSKVEAIDIAISALEENDKLKAEIEQYKSALTTWNNANNEMLKFNQELKDKIEELKSELEQSKITRNKQIDVLLQEIKQLESIINIYEVKKDFKEFCDRRDREESKLKFREVK